LRPIKGVAKRPQSASRPMNSRAASPPLQGWHEPIAEQALLEQPTEHPPRSIFPQQTGRVRCGGRREVKFFDRSTLIRTDAAHRGGRAAPAVITRRAHGPDRPASGVTRSHSEFTERPALILRGGDFHRAIGPGRGGRAWRLGNARSDDCPRRAGNGAGSNWTCGRAPAGGPAGIRIAVPPSHGSTVRPGVASNTVYLLICCTAVTQFST
jgi:hypothetical protein